MSECTYNTDHGNFRIKAVNVPFVLDALWAAHVDDQGITPEDNAPKFANIRQAFGELGLEIKQSDAGDILNLFLAVSCWDAAMETAFNTIAPWVEPESYLTFAFGGSEGCWAFCWVKNNEGKVICTNPDVATVTIPDLERILQYLRYVGVTAPGRQDALDLYTFLCDKYATDPMIQAIENETKEA